MSLLGIMMLLLFGSLRISVRNWDAGETRIDEISQMAAVQNFFQRHLTAAQPEQLQIVAEDRFEFVFQGDSKTLRFAAVLPASAARKGLQVFSIKLQETELQQTIVVGIEPLYPAAKGQSWKKEEVLLAENVSSFNLTYYGSPDNAPDSDWFEDWLEQRSLPALVKIAIEFENGIYWPSMVFGIRMAKVGEFKEEDDIR